ncbi:MAG TPA: ArsA-related P-loop ATPase [Solirubrobacteraceae bacterium]|nr:ArsA-related P-loop ATPase [Solirubrobacteraceae bacterium]
MLDRRLVFLLGKGGVGRSTLAAALGLLGARDGRRTAVVEVSGRGDVPRLFGVAGRVGVEMELSAGLWTLDVDPRVALEEYLVDQLPLRTLAEVVGSSNAFGYVAAATPGLRELLTMGKVWELAQPQRRSPGTQPYDLVVVDAPATGHGLALLAAPRTFADAAGRGPIARQGAMIAETLEDRSQTAVLAVATAEPAAVDEALELRAALDGRLGAVLVNALGAERYSGEDRIALEQALARPDLDAASRAALTTAVADAHAARRWRSELARLDAQTLELPDLGPAPVSRAGLELLADRLAALA